jgi:hypothetical protein
VSGELLEALLRHARLFGTEGIVESADGLSAGELAILRVELARLDSAGRGLYRPRHRRSLAATRAAVWDLDERGLVIGAIAEKLDLTEPTVRRGSGSPGRSGRQAGNPHG